MKIILKYACSLDGYLDDTSANRFIFSSKEDAAAVDSLRSKSDAILIGAGTLRSDNPSLLIKSPVNINARLAKGLPKQPQRVIVSRDPASFSIDWNIFQGIEDSPVHLISNSRDLPMNLLPFHLPSEGEVSPKKIIQLLKKHGISTLLVEGGPNLLEQFLVSKLNLILRVSIAPLLLGAAGRSKIAPQSLKHLKLIGQEKYSGNTILWFEKS